MRYYASIYFTVKTSVTFKLAQIDLSVLRMVKDLCYNNINMEVLRCGVKLKCIFSSKWPSQRKLNSRFNSSVTSSDFCLVILWFVFMMFWFEFSKFKITSTIEFDHCDGSPLQIIILHFGLKISVAKKFEVYIVENQWFKIVSTCYYLNFSI